MKLGSTVDQRVLRWFGHMERMKDFRMVRMVLAEVNGGRVQGRQRIGWMDGVTMAFGSRGIMVMHNISEDVESPGAYLDD